MDESRSRDLLVNPPDPVEVSGSDLETDPPRTIPGPPLGETKTSAGKTFGRGPDAGQSVYRSIFVCASRPPEHPTPKASAGRSRDHGGQAG